MRELIVKVLVNAIGVCSIMCVCFLLCMYVYFVISLFFWPLPWGERQWLQILGSGLLLGTIPSISFIFDMDFRI